MKRKRNREIVLFIFLIPIFLGITFLITTRLENQMPSYSIMNKSRRGCSVFFETLKALDYPVKQTLLPLEKCDPQTIQIVTDNQRFDINHLKTKNWVKRGGVLIYLSKYGFNNLEYGDEQKNVPNITIYSFENGHIISMQPYGITNEDMIISTNQGYELLKVLEDYPNRMICFNEAHLFLDIDRKSMWDYIPIGIKFLIYQFIIVMISFFYLKGKRFGKTIPLYEEVERTENEYLYSVAYLYQKGKCLDLIVDIYYQNFLMKIPIIYDDWLYYWKKEQLPFDLQAKKLHDFMNDRTKKLTFIEVMHIVRIIEKLKSILDKRRESYWKTLKTDL